MSEKRIIETVEAPASQQFACPDCKGPCVIYPRLKPVGVQHSIPTCRTWQLVSKDKAELGRYLIKAGVHLLVPEGEA